MFIGMGPLGVAIPVTVATLGPLCPELTAEWKVEWRVEWRMQSVESGVWKEESGVCRVESVEYSVSAESGKSSGE